LGAAIFKGLSYFSNSYPRTYPQKLWKILTEKYMTPERYAKILQVLNNRQSNLTVITDEVHKGRNISAIVRTCDAVGIDTIHVVTPKAGFQNYRGTALGSQKWVTTAQHDSVATPINLLREKGFQIVAAHLSETALNYRDIDYTKPTALLLGGEKPGPSQYSLESVDHHITIPMMGMVGSLNVSVACSIIMAEAQRQRTDAGLYGNDCLPKPLFNHRLFNWCQPTLAAYCDKHNLQYPELDDTGGIIEGPVWYRAVRDKMKLS